MTFSTIRTAIQAEVARVTKELKKLQGLLATLDGDANAPAASKPRGRPAKPKADLPAVLSIIKGVKKINAVSLGHQLRKRGLAKIPTAQLVEAGVKVTGTKGGTTYSYAG